MRRDDRQSGDSWITALAAGLTLGVVASAGAVGPISPGPGTIRLAGPLPVLAGFHHVTHWRAVEVASDRRVIVSPEIRSSAGWDELVVSWNVEPANGAGLRIEAQAIQGSRSTRFYRMGDWSLGRDAPLPRTSPADEGDAQGRVKTDTLVLRDAASAVRLRLTLVGELARHPERLRLLTVSLSNEASRPPPRPPRRDVWGRTLAVPERSQISYAGGEGWCSPTAISMVLAWWARELKRPELDRDVPDVAAGVHDPAWPGTGNWPFNTAYAGSFSGMRAYAARLPDLRAVEDLVAEGVPVVVSVHPPLLRGKPSGEGGGHLIVCVGFTKAGDAVANDPWARVEEGQRVRRIYRRNNLERAWEHSQRLAYVIAPADRAAVGWGEWHGTLRP